MCSSDLLASCGGGDSSPPATGGTPGPTPTPPTSGRLFADPAAESLSIAEVQQILAQAVGEAQARSLPGTIAVVDRVGNVLAVFAMNNTPAATTVSRQQIGGLAAAGQEIGLQGADVPTVTAAIAKAITGAYLSSGGNA